jgi:hypothetical protein
VTPCRRGGQTLRGGDLSVHRYRGFAPFPEITPTVADLREVLDDERYESIARVGRAMTNAAMSNYAVEQIDLARPQLSSPSAPT